MRKNILLFLVAIVFAAKSQVSYNRMLIKDTTTWQHFGFFAGLRSPLTSTIIPSNNSIAALDTISINSITYRKLYQLNVPAYLNYGNKSLLGYIREDSIAKKVFFREGASNPEFILYDFSLNVGDSTYLVFPNNGNSTGYYRVDSIVSKNEVCGARKHFYLRKHTNNVSPSFEYFDWIESIGSTFHLLYLYDQSGLMPMGGYYGNGCIHPWLWGLACKNNSGILQYKSCTSQYPATFGTTYFSPCVYYFFGSGIKNHSGFRIAEIFPNPAAEKINIQLELEKALSVNFSILDISGRIVKNSGKIDFNVGSKAFSFDISGIQNGVYTLVIESENYKASQLIFVENGW